MEHHDENVETQSQTIALILQMIAVAKANRFDLNLVRNAPREIPPKEYDIIDVIRDLIAVAKMDQSDLTPVWEALEEPVGVRLIRIAGKMPRKIGKVTIHHLKEYLNHKLGTSPVQDMLIEAISKELDGDALAVVGAVGLLVVVTLALEARRKAD